MQISIIIPALNEAGKIESVLRNARAMTGFYEVIVADGGSTDNTVSLAKGYTRVISSPSGRAVQMNAGAREAQGDVLLFLHADTALPENALSLIEEALRNESVIGGRFKVKLDCPKWQYRLVGACINRRDALVNGFTGDQAIFIRTSVFWRLGGYAEMPLMEDLEFGKRMLKTGKVVRLPVPVVTSARRWQKGGFVKTVLLMWMLKLFYYSGYPPERLVRFYGDTR